MKKVIALTTCAFLVLSSLAIIPGSGYGKLMGIDVVSAATETTSTTPTKSTGTTKTTTGTTKTTSVTKTTPKTPYQDGVYVAYGNASTKGTEGVKVTIKDGKIAGLDLMRTSPAVIDRDPRFNYRFVWEAYEKMKSVLIGKTREQARAVDTVSGATRSTTSWKLAVDRAFTRASTVKPIDQTYFIGQHMGVDPQSKYAVFATYDKNKLTAVKVYPMANGNILESNLTDYQIYATAAYANEILKNGLNMKPVAGYESEYQAIYNALWDAEKNAKIYNGNKYMDGFYSSYGDGSTHGAERADIYIRNDKIVDVQLYRLATNLIDVGNSFPAHPEVITAKTTMPGRFLANGGAFLQDKVDSVSGATRSSDNWNMAIRRAVAKAAKTPSSYKYFDGTFAGVDNQSNLLVLVTMKNDKATDVQTYLLDPATHNTIADASLTDDQKALLAQLNSGLLKSGTSISDIKGNEAVSAQARAAYEDMLANASKAQGQYKDGTFTGAGEPMIGHSGLPVGDNVANVTLRNGKIVGIQLLRVNSNYVDKGNTAHAEVVKNIPRLVVSFLQAATRDIVQKVDAAFVNKATNTVDSVTGATVSTDQFKLAIERAYEKAEIDKVPKVAFQDGSFGGDSKDASVFAVMNFDKNLPASLDIYYLDKDGNPISSDKLSEDQKVVAADVKLYLSGCTSFATGAYSYAHGSVAIGHNDAQKAISAKVIEAINAAFVNAGR